MMRFVLWATWVSLGLVACSDPESTSADDPDAGIVEDRGLDAQAPADLGLDADAEADAEADADIDAAPIDHGADASPPACAPETPESCIYRPEVEDEPGMRRTVELTYTAIAGTPRTFAVEVRAPANASAQTPIVIWSHGGSGGRNVPADVAVEWSQAFMRAGYMTIVIAHPGHDVASYGALCEALELDFCAATACQNHAGCSVEVAGVTLPGSCVDDTCRYFKPINWDRPNDVRAVIDWIEAEANGVFAGRADATRIVYAGHSAGAGATNMVAGVMRQFQPGSDRLLIDRRPLGFISCSPQGPQEDGFTLASFDAETCRRLADPADQASCLSRPHLTLTGVDDDGIGPLRRQSFDLAPPGNRFLAYILEETAQHTTFNHQTESCERAGGTPERCAQQVLWLESAALAFLDATLRESPRARAYLTSTNLATLAAGAMSWEQR